MTEIRSRSAFNRSLLGLRTGLIPYARFIASAALCRATASLRLSFSILRESLELTDVAQSNVSLQIRLNSSIYN